MSEKDQKPRKIKRRRSTGRVAGTTQSGFANRSMSSILQQQQDQQSGSDKPKEDDEGHPSPPAPADD